MEWLEMIREIELINYFTKFGKKQQRKLSKNIATIRMNTKIWLVDSNVLNQNLKLLEKTG